MPLARNERHMALRRGDWPITPDQLRSAIENGETTLVEFKRSWWPLGPREGQAKLAKHVMAMANAVGREELGLLIFGVEDERRGTTIIPVEDPPIPESIAQILTGYVHPQANVQCRHYSFPEGTVSAVAVLHASTRPHYCLRDYPDVISTRDVYVRRDKQVGTLAPPELEQMIREKDRELGPPRLLDPVAFGFVSLDAGSFGTTAIRITNLATEPLTDVAVFFDVVAARDPSLRHRERTLSNATLMPGESRECTLNLNVAHFYKVYWTFADPPVRKLELVRDLNFVGDRWLDIAATLLFRSPKGLLDKRVVTVPVSG
jgi:hypothetical protein